MEGDEATHGLRLGMGLESPLNFISSAFLHTRFAIHALVRNAFIRLCLLKIEFDTY